MTISCYGFRMSNSGEKRKRVKKSSSALATSYVQNKADNEIMTFEILKVMHTRHRRFDFQNKKSLIIIYLAKIHVHEYPHFVV